MQAILLAAGYATRLYPLTKSMPKALLSVGGQTMLDHLVSGIRTIDEVDDITVISNDRFYRQLADWAVMRDDARLCVMNDGTDSNDNRLGAIGDILHVLRHRAIDDDVLIVAADNLLSIDMKAYHQQYVRIGRKPLLLGQHCEDEGTLRRFAVATVDAQGKVLSLEEKPHNPKGNQIIFALYLYPASALRLLPAYAAQGGSLDAPGSFPQWLHSRMDVYVHPAQGPCYDVGTHEALAQVRSLYGP